MKKNIVALTLVPAILMVSLTGCGSTPKEETEIIAEQTESTENIDGTEITQKENEESITDSVVEETEENEEEIKAQQEAEANVFYENGRADLYGLEGHEINFESAYANFEKAKDLEKQDANFYLGLLYDWYSYPEQNFEMAKTYYEDSGDNPYAMLALGFLYYNGQGVEQDVEKATEMFQNVVDQGCVEGYDGLGRIAIDNSDYEVALENWNKVSEGTEQIFVANAMYNIGELYYYGNGVEQDYVKALECYEKAAELGDRGAMHNIGWAYQKGEGTEQDYENALEWYEKAADLGLPDSMNQIGWMLYQGEGIEPDYEKAFGWFEKAANLGNSGAMSTVGWMYHHGEGVEQDYAKAKEWYEKAIDLENTEAMRYIAQMYIAGEGVEKDYDKALEWCEKAADLGNEQAKEDVEFLKQNPQ